MKLGIKATCDAVFVVKYKPQFLLALEEVQHKPKVTVNITLHSADSVDGLNKINQTSDRRHSSQTALRGSA